MLNRNISSTGWSKKLFLVHFLMKVHYICHCNLPPNWTFPQKIVASKSMILPWIFWVQMKCKVEAPNIPYDMPCLSCLSLFVLCSWYQLPPHLSNRISKTPCMQGCKFSFCIKLEQSVQFPEEQGSLLSTSSGRPPAKEIWSSFYPRRRRKEWS